MPTQLAHLPGEFQHISLALYLPVGQVQFLASRAKGVILSVHRSKHSPGRMSLQQMSTLTSGLQIPKIREKSVFQLLYSSRARDFLIAISAQRMKNPLNLLSTIDHLVAAKPSCNGSYKLLFPTSKHPERT